VKFNRAKKMLERFALCAPADEVAQRGEFRLGEGAVKGEVEVHALGEAKDMGKKVLDVEARTFHPCFREVRGG
jgi:hypothetical protein